MFVKLFLDIQWNKKKEIIGAIGINFVEKCMASGKLETAFEVLNKMLERKIHFYLLSSHSDSAGSGSIVQTAVNVSLHDTVKQRFLCFGINLCRDFTILTFVINLVPLYVNCYDFYYGFIFLNFVLKISRQTNVM